MYTDSDAQAFSKAANGVGKTKFFLAFADNAALCDHFGVTRAPTILVFTDYETKAIRYRGKMTSALDIAKFVNMVRVGVLCDTKLRVLYDLDICATQSVFAQGILKGRTMQKLPFCIYYQYAEKSSIE